MRIDVISHETLNDSYWDCDMGNLIEHRKFLFHKFAC